MRTAQYKTGIIPRPNHWSRFVMTLATHSLTPAATGPAGPNTRSPVAGAPGAPTARPIPLELDDLTQRCLGSLALVERLLASFEQRFPIELCEIAQSLEAGDVPRLVRSAHQLKGAAANMSAPMLRSILEHVEHAARAENLTPIAGYLAELEAEWERFCRFRSGGAAAPGAARSVPNALPAGAKPSIGD
jgi:HPt (histidine-containing phosphotransfer) domain-containing protein